MQGSIHNKFVIPKDVLSIPVKELSLPTHQKPKFADSDISLSRPGYRGYSSVVCVETWNLLNEFSSPMTLVNGIVAYANKSKQDPNEVFDFALPVFEKMIHSKILIPEGSAFETKNEFLFDISMEINGYIIIDQIQSLEDTQVYKLKNQQGEYFALKIQVDDKEETAISIKKEEAILKRLGGKHAPRLICAGEYNDKVFIIMDWVDGISIQEYTRSLKTLQECEKRRQFKSILIKLLTAYRYLHRNNIIHDDLNPRNILIGENGEIRLIDFGTSHIINHGNKSISAHNNRSGFAWLMDPLLAEAFLMGYEVIPKSSFKSEQYALTSLVYYLYTEQYYINECIDKDEYYQSIINDPPIGFTLRRIPAWPELEQILNKGLAKLERDRYTDINAYLLDVKSLSLQEEDLNDSLFFEAQNEWIDEYIGKIEHCLHWNELIKGSSTLSFQSGVCGIAYALYRIGQIKNDNLLLCKVKIELERILYECDSPDHFIRLEDKETGANVVSACSPHHAKAGIFLLHSMVSSCIGDLKAMSTAANLYLDMYNEEEQNIELCFGLSGYLIGLLMIINMFKYNNLISTDLEHLAIVIFQKLEQTLDLDRKEYVNNSLRHIGLAHGVEGVLYTLLLASQFLGQTLSDRTIGLLKATANRFVSDNAVFPGWCQGNAGFIYLYSQAYLTLGDESYLELAEQAGENLILQPVSKNHLCCGLAGCVQAFLRLYKVSGKLEYKKRAEQFHMNGLKKINLDSESEQVHYSLFWGPLSTVLNHYELRFPEHSIFPFLELEGW